MNKKTPICIKKWFCIVIYFASMNMKTKMSIKTNTSKINIKYNSSYKTIITKVQRKYVAAGRICV